MLLVMNTIFITILSSVASATALYDDNIGKAVEAWLWDAQAAEETYGHISEWDVSGVTDMMLLFNFASDFNDDISQWNVSNVTNMRRMFYRAESFNGDLSNWNVSRVRDMSAMFYGADSFNRDLTTWNVSAVCNMEAMFSHADNFNGDISGWDVSSVYNMDWMFNHAEDFSGDISGWIVSNVSTMEFMFHFAESFNSDISDWDVSGVVSMRQMFAWADVFNGDLSRWDVSSVKRMGSMFYGTVFDGDISDWDVSSVQDMENMFEGATLFNSDLSRWDVSNVLSMSGMFCHARSFNGDLSKWDVSSVCHMDNMFCDTPFNGDISRWDTRTVVLMDGMFKEAREFNSDISYWNVSAVTSMSKMFWDASSFNGDLRFWDVSGVTTFWRMFYNASSFNGDLCWNISEDVNTEAMMNFTDGGCYDCCDETCVELMEWTEDRALETCPDAIHHSFSVPLCETYDNPDYRKRLGIALANELYTTCDHACLYDYETYDTETPHAFRYSQPAGCYNVATGYYCIDDATEAMESVHARCELLCDLPYGASHCVERVEWSPEAADSNCPDGYTDGDKGYGTAEICDDPVRLYNGFYESAADLYSESFNSTLANHIFWSCSSTCMYDIANVGTLVYNWKSSRNCWAAQTEWSCFTDHKREYEWAKEYIIYDVCPEPTPAPVTYDCVERELDWSEDIANEICDSNWVGSPDKSHNATVCPGYEDWQYRLNDSLANRVFPSCSSWCVYDIYKRAEEAFIWRGSSQCYKPATSGICIGSSEQAQMQDYIDNILCESQTPEPTYQPTCAAQMDWSEDLMDEHCSVSATGSTYKHYATVGRAAVACEMDEDLGHELLKSLAQQLYETCSSWCVYDFYSEAEYAWKWKSSLLCWQRLNVGYCFTGSQTEEWLAAKKTIGNTCTNPPTSAPTGCIPDYDWTYDRAEELCSSSIDIVANKSYGVEVCSENNSGTSQMALEKSLANKFYQQCSSWCVYDYDTIANNIKSGTSNQGGFTWSTTGTCWQWVTGYMCFSAAEYHDVIAYAQGLCNIG